jgi:uncharacterized protein
MAHPNLERTKQAYDAYARGDLEALMGLMTDDVVWHVAGDTPISGDYHGKEELAGFFMKVAEMSKGTFRVEPEETIANDHYAVTLVRASVEREGMTLEREPDVHVARYRDGLLCEFWSHPYDLELFNEVWSA